MRRNRWKHKAQIKVNFANSSPIQTIVPPFICICVWYSWTLLFQNEKPWATINSYLQTAKKTPSGIPSKKSWTPGGSLKARTPLTWRGTAIKRIIVAHKWTSFGEATLLIKCFIFMGWGDGEGGGGLRYANAYLYRIHQLCTWSPLYALPYSSGRCMKHTWKLFQFCAVSADRGNRAIKTRSCRGVVRMRVGWPWAGGEVLSFSLRVTFLDTMRKTLFCRAVTSIFESEVTAQNGELKGSVHSSPPYVLTLSLPSSKTAFSQPCKENCITEGSESW